MCNRATCCNGSISSLPREPRHSLVPPATRAREVFDGPAGHLFQFIFGICNFSLKSVIREIAKVSMGHGVRSALEARMAQLSHLAARNVACHFKKTDGHIECRVEICLFKNG